MSMNPGNFTKAMATLMATLMATAITSCAAASVQPFSVPQAGGAAANPLRWKAARSAADGKPAPPSIFLDTKYVPPGGRTIRVPAGPDAARQFQAALERAKAGDAIELDAGASYFGNFTLPYKAEPSTDYILIRSARAGELRESTRVSPADSALMARLVSPNTVSVLRAAPSAHHYRFIGIEFTIGPGVDVNHNLIRLGDGGETEYNQLPHDLIIDRCYIHGTATQTVRRGIALNSASTAVIDSYISDIHEEGADSQAICGWNGPGPYKITNNYLEAAGENVMFGGADPAVKELVPSDIEFRYNHCRKPLSWRIGDPSFAGKAWTVKNLFELKNAQRVLIEGNLFENCWTHGQVGYAILLKSVNQDGAAPWSVTQDVDFRNNIVRHAAGGVNIQGRGSGQNGGQTQRLRISNNLFEDITTRWVGEGAFLKISETAGVEVDHNTVLQDGSIIIAYGPPTTNFVFTNNVVHHNDYGVKGDGVAAGKDTLEKFFPNCLFKRNVVVGGQKSQYPADNFFLAAAADIGFVDTVKKDYRLADKSSYKNAATDGRDIGCDLSLLQAAWAAVQAKSRD